MVDAVVVGSGPNGLAAAVHLAGAGRSVLVLEASDAIGGGTRTEELTVPGVHHDVCSAFHPLAVASPFLRSLPLAEHGLHWCAPEIDLVHPLDNGRAGVLTRSLDATCAGLGSDGTAWQRLVGPCVDEFDGLLDDLLQPMLHVPAHPVRMARFGLRAVTSASRAARHLTTPEARGLFGGIAAHAFQPLGRPTTAAIGIVLAAAAHHSGWPVAEGGSGSITDALAALLRARGGSIETDVRVDALSDLPPHQVALFDVSPTAMVQIAGAALPTRVARAYQRYRYGPAAWKIDLAVEGEVPWTADPARRAGVVHLGGTFEELATSATAVHRGEMPERPFVLVGQQHLADPTRSRGDVHPIWAYAHVPHGWEGDATEAIMRQLERFAPGVRDQVVGTAVRTPSALAAHNANYVGGDISTGANDPWQMVFRPRLALDPYATGIPGVFLCSAATPPGAGVHGMCGYQAARRALAHLDRRAGRR